MLEALHRIATDASLRRVMQIAIHRVEYVEELGAVQARHLQMHRQWLARNRSALERAFAERPGLPPCRRTWRRWACRCWSKACCKAGCWTLAGL